MIVVLVSGGKDSTASLVLALEEFGNREVIGIFTDTGWEAECTYRYLDYLENKLGVRILRLRNERWNGLLDLIEKKKRFPSALFRFCTAHFKIVPVAEFLANTDIPIKEIWIGIRRDESRSRKKRYSAYLSDATYDYHEWLSSVSGGDVRKAIIERIKEKNIKIRFPILDWSSEDVLTFLARRGITLNPLYLRGHRRVGCYPCVLGSLNEFRLCWKDEEGKRNIIRFAEVENRLRSRGYMARLKDGMTAKQLIKRLEQQDLQLDMFCEESCEICRI